ncbi:MAG: hypothetical protein QXU32_02075 [Nitrososphaerales archaeon]
MKFINRLEIRLIPPPTDPHAGMILEDKITDDLYNAYVKYVGKKDALPQDELQMFDLKDQFGRLRPINTWPTKSTREYAKKIWDEYNRRLQARLSKATNDIDPCEDPDKYIAMKYNECIRASRSASDRRKCKKQIEKLRDAIDAYCHSVGMGEISDPFIASLYSALEKSGPVLQKHELSDSFITSLYSALEKYEKDNPNV